MTKRIIHMRVLPGEPLNGGGRVCIHLVVRDERGSFTEPHVIHPKCDDVGEVIKGEAEVRPTRCRLVCDAKRQVAPVTKNGVTTVTPRTEDPRAVTCPKCIASKEYAELMALLEA